MLLSTLDAIFKFICGIGAILVALSLTTDEENRFPIIKTIITPSRTHRPILLIVTIVSIFGTAVIGIIEKHKPQQQRFILVRTHDGNIIQEANVDSFKMELKEESNKNIIRAEDFFKVGNRNFEEEKYEEASTNYLQSVNIIPTMSGYLNLGVSYGHIHKLDQSESAFNAGLRISREKADKGFESVFLGNLGIVQRMNRDFSRAKETLLKALKLAQTLGVKENLGGYYTNLGNVYADLGDDINAEKMHEASLKIQKELNQDSGVAIAYGNLGIIYQKRKDLPKAEENHLEALKIDKKLDIKEGIARHLTNLGNTYMDFGQDEKARSCHFEAMQINKQLGYQKDMLLTNYDKLGSIYRKQGNSDMAIEMYSSALKTSEELKLNQEIGDYSTYLGNIYAARNEFDLAKKMYEKALDIDLILGSKEGIALHSGNLGNVYCTFGDLDRAEKLYNEALNIDKELNNERGVARHLLNLGNLYYKRGDLKDAGDTYIMAKDQVMAIKNKDSRDNEMLGNITSNFGRLLKEVGDFPGAERMYQEALHAFELAGVKTKVNETKQVLQSFETEESRK